MKHIEIAASRLIANNYNKYQQLSDRIMNVHVTVCPKRFSGEKIFELKY